MGSFTHLVKDIQPWLYGYPMGQMSGLILTRSVVIASSHSALFSRLAQLSPQVSKVTTTYSTSCLLISQMGLSKDCTQWDILITHGLTPPVPSLTISQMYSSHGKTTIGCLAQTTTRSILTSFRWRPIPLCKI